MKLGDLRNALSAAMDADALIPLREDAEVVIESGDHWLRAELVSATFLRGRWTLLIHTAKPGDPMWLPDETDAPCCTGCGPGCACGGSPHKGGSDV